MKTDDWFIRHRDIIIIPYDCPKCRNHNVLCSDWMCGQYVFLSLYCQNCGFFWRETIDFDI